MIDSLFKGTVISVLLLTMVVSADQAKSNNAPAEEEYFSSQFLANTYEADPDQFIEIKNGHLYLGEKRVRFWAVSGGFPNKNAAGSSTHAANRACVKRLKEHGFNMVRLWQAPYKDYKKGDGSREDLIDHIIYCFKKEGFRIWSAQFVGIEGATAEEVSILDDPTTEEEWKEAMGEEEVDIAEHLGRYYDERIHRLCVKRMKRILNHVNQYTGLRYADDPVFVAWELVNEHWWFNMMKRGKFLNYPAFFRKELYSQWNDYLHKKYKTSKALDKAWIGNLLPDESFDKKNIRLLPLIRAVRDDQAATLGVGVSAEAEKQQYDPAFFNEKRGGDVIEFLLDLWITHKQREVDAIRNEGEAIKRAPVVWENGVGWGMPTQYMQQHADVISHDSYWNGTFQTDPNHKRFPWSSQLEELPKISWDKPWLEQNRMEGKPFFVYETGYMQPGKYRAEYPMTLARTGAIQDWDVICWHYWGWPQDTTQEEPYNKPMDYATKKQFTQGYHFQFDEVYNSSLKAAATIFTRGHLKPAPNPTKFIFGRKSLYSWSMNGYGDAGDMFVPTAYRYGMRLLIDPERENDEIIGPRVKYRGVFESCPIEPTDEISIDWQCGHLMFDAPGTAMYCGFLAQYPDKDNVAFENGVTLQDVVITNPPDMPYPVKKDEKYIEFCIVSSDGKPLKETDNAIISLVSTSFNRGFELDEKQHANQEWNPIKEWNINVDAITMPNDTTGDPVCVARVGGTVIIPMLDGMKYQFIDWHSKVIKEGTVKNGRLTIPSTMPVFITKLYRK
ncbi:MAG: hypothetical protein GF401_10590 [Chitinivibrionales bacterium]|nr:hypothetical protein [Chitinivibrionales bacterium]